jgi:uncharacterized SAM-binding protein YcdF (DUF218 family)
MLFFLKKFITFWLMPLPFCLTLVVAGWWLSRPSRRPRGGRGLIAAGAALLVFFSSNLASNWLLRPLEGRYPPIPELAPGQPPTGPLAACRYVVVLGSGHADMAGFSATNQLSTAGLSRIVEGVRLLRALPGAQLIVSGPGVHGRPSHAAILARAAVSLGVDPARIRLIDTARDTEDESRAVKAIVADAPIALVTSAFHMPRAYGDFRRAGVTALPCPADFMVRAADGFHWTDVSWDTESLGRSTAAVHERVGQLWMWLRDRI